MIRLSLYLFLWVGSMAIAIFATQNTYLVSLRLFNFESIKLPLGLLLIFCMGFGAIFINFWQTSISFQFPKMPKLSMFSAKKNPPKNQTANKQSVPKQNISKNTNSTDSFDSDWNDDWE